MRKRGNSSIPSRQIYSVGPSGRNKLPGKGCRPEWLFESIYSAAVSIPAKNTCYLFSLKEGEQLLSTVYLVVSGLYLFKPKVTRAQTLPGLFL